MEPRNTRFTIEYDGTRFAGWQLQPGQRTVQGVLEAAVLDLCVRVAGEIRVESGGAERDGPGPEEGAVRQGISERIPLTGAGRTDAGVHALAQVASATLPIDLPPETIASALNSRLPDDLFVRRAEVVDADFNARFDAVARSYVYLIGREESPLWRLRRWCVRPDLDIEPMRGAARTLAGEHDFSSFCLAGSEPEHHRCRVRAISLEWEPGFGGMLVFRVEANRFLRGMVRSIVGTLVDVGRGRTTPEDFSVILEALDRGRAGATAPAHGLYLERVTYTK